MKKFLVLIATLSFVSCEEVTFEDIAEPIEPMEMEELVYYDQDIAPIVEANCVVCHMPNGAAGFAPLTNFTEVSNSIEGILDRIQRPDGDPLKMPQGGTLSPAQINIFLQWQEDGLLESEP